jgi:hypothetical protein
LGTERLNENSCCGVGIENSLDAVLLGIYFATVMGDHFLLHILAAGCKTPLSVETNNILIGKFVEKYLGRGGEAFCWVICDDRRCLVMHVVDQSGSIAAYSIAKLLRIAPIAE